MRKKDREHTGNLRYAHLVEIHQQKYENGSKLEKTIIAGKIVTMVLGLDDRFLRMD
jgi:hypothetical protein